MLGTFAESVPAAGIGHVADLGCGPGRITAYLQSLGLDTFGIDLSPEMIRVARATYPDLRFDVGSIDALDVADNTLAGIVAWYSIIHTPPERLPHLFAEFSRVCVPGTSLLLAFQVGGACVHLEHAYGHPISLDAYRMRPDTIVALLEQAGFVVHINTRDAHRSRVRRPNRPMCSPGHPRGREALSAQASDGPCTSAMRDQPPGTSTLTISGMAAKSSGASAVAFLKCSELTWASPAAASSNASMSTYMFGSSTLRDQSKQMLPGSARAARP